MSGAGAAPAVGAGEGAGVLKLVHTADWHLGVRFGQFAEACGLKLQQSRTEAVRRILGLAHEVGAGVLLCAGDLFDDREPERPFWEELARLFRQGPWKGPTVLLPGNHDPLCAGSVYEPAHAFRRALPDHVHVVDRDDFALEIGAGLGTGPGAGAGVGSAPGAAAGAIVHAVPCRSRAGALDLAAALPARAEGDRRLRIALVHGSTFGAGAAGRFAQHFPIPPDLAERRGFDYVALGDFHSFERVAGSSERAPAVYPGAPEPTKFGEHGAGQVALVRLRAGEPARVEARRVGRWSWRDERVDSLAALRALCLEDLLHAVLRLRLDLHVDLPGLDEVEALVASLQGTAAAGPKVGVLALDRRGLVVDAGAGVFPADLPPVLRDTLARLEAERDGAVAGVGIGAGSGDGASPAEEGRERGRRRAVAERAIRHLYRLVKEPG